MKENKTAENFLRPRVPSRGICWAQGQKILCSFVFIIISLFIFNFVHKPDFVDIKYVKIAGQSVKVDLALTAAEQMQGLSGRTELKENEGMLFIFPQSGNYPFWMKDMNFPIDMIWLGEDLKVVYIKKDAQPESYPKTYGPDVSGENAKYVLEVGSGFADKNNLKVGDKIENFVSP